MQMLSLSALTKVHILGPNGNLICPIRESATQSYGELAQMLHSMVRREPVLLEHVCNKKLWFYKGKNITHVVHLRTFELELNTKSQNVECGI